MIWPPSKIWQDAKDVFVVGGGSSVRTFPISFLENHKVIGCNDAYQFGTSIIDILVFGDSKWYFYHKDRLDFRGFSNPKITNNEKLKNEQGIIFAPRSQSGFCVDSLGWNGNTGSSAINLALILGAKRIFLLGFDMSLDEAGRSNWHLNYLDKPGTQHYKRYIDSMKESINQIEINFPGSEIYNLNPLSSMELFPKRRLEEFYKIDKGNNHNG